MLGQSTLNFLVPELRRVQSKDRAVRVRLAQGLAWVVFALLERVGVNGALYNSLKRAKDAIAGEGNQSSASSTAPVGSSVATVRSSEHASPEADGERQSKRARVA